MGRSSQHPFTGQFVAVGTAHLFDDLREIVYTEILVNLGNLLFEILFVAFRQAAHDKEMVDFAGLFGPDKTENGVDRLLFGIADKATGVDDDNLGVCRVGVVNDIEIVATKLRHQMFRIDKVLRATECENVNKSLFHESALGQPPSLCQSNLSDSGFIDYGAVSVGVFSLGRLCGPVCDRPFVRLRIKT